MKLKDLLESKYPLLRTPNAGEPLAYNIIGFHTTLTENWKSIRARGLIPGRSKPAGQDWAGAFSGKATYFHLALPLHELDSSIFDDELILFCIETRLHAYAGYFVPDEDVSTDLATTPEVIKDHGSVAVGYIIPPSEFICLHFADHPAAREFAGLHAGKFKVQFHNMN